MCELHVGLILATSLDLTTLIICTMESYLVPHKTEKPEASRKRCYELYMHFWNPSTSKSKNYGCVCSTLVIQAYSQTYLLFLLQAIPAREEITIFQGL